LEHDLGWCPFSAGRRACPGAALAELEFKAFVVVLLRSVDWRLARGSVASIKNWPKYPLVHPNNNISIRCIVDSMAAKQTKVH